MRLSARRLSVALVCAALALTPAACTADPAPPDRAVLSADDGGTSAPKDPSVRPGQTSEGIRGEQVAPYPDGLLPRPRIDNVKGWRIVPGVGFRRWDQTDRRGQMRAYLLRIDPSAPGVSLDYQSREYVPERDTLMGLLRRDPDSVAGVNGGFFDIFDTGAPLGVGVDRQRGFLHASLLTWNNAFYLTAKGVPRIGKLEVQAQIDQFPQLRITNVNSPRVRTGSIGIYSPAWGRTSGYSITDGQRRGVRMVVVEDDRVVANTTSLNADKPITGVVLVGRGPGAEALAQLRVGSLATVQWSLPGDPTMAISGERVLLKDGKRKVDDDSELHPRTAVGIDRDSGRVLLLVVDGRQKFSRGATLVEMAGMMRRLGAEDALNLDGGGSSTLVGHGRKGKRKVLNSPSDGSQRSIADAIGVHYDAP